MKMNDRGVLRSDSSIHRLRVLVEEENGRRDYRGPEPVFIAFRRLRNVPGFEHVAAGVVYLLPLVPGLVDVEGNAQR
jgi:hypothetical protein